MRALGLGLLALVLVIAGAELIQLFSAARQTHWLVAAALGTLIGGVGLLAVRSLLSFLGARKSLDQLMGLRHLADRMSGRRTTARRKTLLQTIQKFYSAKPQAAVLNKALDTLPDYSDDARNNFV